MLFFYQFSIIMNGQVSLTSDVHNTQLVQTFSDLFRNKILTDVTLLCEDSFKIEAHKVILCAGSNFFREFFTNNTTNNLTLYMRGIPKHQLMPLVQFLYYGETVVPNRQVQEILTIAKELEISSLDEDKIKGDVKPPHEHEVKQKQNLKIQEKDFNILELASKPNEDTLNDIFDSEFSSSTSALSCESCDFVGLNTESFEKHKKLTHKENVIMNTCQVKEEQSWLTKKDLSADGDSFLDGVEYLEPSLVLKQTPRSPYWPFFKFVKTTHNGPYKTVHCMPCLEAIDVRKRKKDITFNGGTSNLKFHLENYHSELIGRSGQAV